MFAGIEPILNHSFTICLCISPDVDGYRVPCTSMCFTICLCMSHDIFSSPDGGMFHDMFVC
jgi:hypothetical protein